METQGGVGGGGTQDFERQGWSKDFSEVEIFDFRIVLRR